MLSLQLTEVFSTYRRLDERSGLHAEYFEMHDSDALLLLRSLTSKTISVFKLHISSKNDYTLQ